MTLLTVPVIDLAPYSDGTDKLGVARAVDRACRDIGFLVVGGHGVSPALIERTRAAGRAFFDLPLAAKQLVARPAPTVARGYIGMEEESVGRSRDPNATAGDLNESLMIGPVDLPSAAYAIAGGPHFAPNIWPTEPADLRAAWSEYYRAMGSLAETLMRIFALALGREEHFFDPMVNHHISRLRVRNYPAPTVLPLLGQIRAGAHSDYGSLTILCTEDRAGGLQACNAEGTWVNVPILPDTFIVNIGDLLARWTNDEWVSTLHRVVNPPAGAEAASRRQSLVFFHNPNYDAPIENLSAEPAKYQPTTSGGHLARLFAATQNPAVSTNA